MSNVPKFRKSAASNSSLLECQAVRQGKETPAFRIITVYSFQKSISPNLLELLDPEDVGKTMMRNVGIYLPNNIP
jgi:hypothetical protein